MCEKPRRTGTKTGRAADRSPVLPLRAADATPLDLFCRASATTRGGGVRSREDFSHESSREERASAFSNACPPPPIDRFEFAFDLSRYFLFHFELIFVSK